MVRRGRRNKVQVVMDGVKFTVRSRCRWVLIAAIIAIVLIAYFVFG